MIAICNRSLGFLFYKEGVFTMDSNNKSKYKVTSPIYLLRSSEECWKCDVKQEVVALAVTQIYSGDPGLERMVNEDAKPFIIFYVEDMPQEILEHICSVHPMYEKRMSRTTGFTYYMNTCTCGASFGDFYLHQKFGGAFCPMSEEDAMKVSIEKLPFTRTFDFVCDYSVGQGAFIFEHAKRN